MASTPTSAGIVSFGEFEADIRSRELLRQGSKVRLTDQSFCVLAMLLERPGELVTREEFAKRLWPAETFVDFDHGLNNAVNRLREALIDSADSPRFIETLPRRGYRFIAKTNGIRAVNPRSQVGNLGPGAADHSGLLNQQAALPKWSRHRWMLWAIPVFAALAVFGSLRFPRVRGWVFGESYTRTSREIKSLAVLPLENLTGDSSQDYFVDGMTDALITNLTKLDSLRVISRTSAMHYKGTHKALPEIARELSVNAVIEGSVVRSGNRVRVRVQLVDAVTDQNLWAHNYDSNLQDVLQLQNELATAVAREVAGKLTPQEQNRLARAQTVNAEAYQLYLKARYFWNKRTQEGYNKAIQFFQQAIAIQPDYAQAYAGLADSYALLGIETNGGSSRSETISLARANALKALEIDGTLAEAHASLASISFIYDWDWSLTEKEFKRAIQLNPGYATAHHWYAYYCVDRGRTEEGLGEIRLAQQLDPLSPIINNDVGHILYMSRRYDEAIEEARKTLEMDPNLYRPHLWRGLAYLAKQQYTESIAELETGVRLSGGDPALTAYLGMVYAEADRREEAQNILKQIRAMPSDRYDSMPELAWILAALGERDQAFAWLEKIYPQRPVQFKNLRILPFLDPLRSDPRFQDLELRVGL